ncbi:MAG TPA: 3D domain-containing protein [Phycisphaerales bacterium]|nr:3D domain-containing protein [Phycisphaerales bacterium]
MDVKTRTTPTPETLHRNRRLLIAGVLTVLPAAAIAPSLIGPARGPAILTVVDQMSVETITDAGVNEQAVQAVEVVRRTPSNADLDAATQIRMSRGEIMLARIAAEDAPHHFESKSEIRMFNGRPVRAARTITMLVTAYSPDERSCGESADGITASGYSVWTNAMKMVAADTDVLPFGTLLSVPGYDNASIVPVLDRGGAIKGNRLDVLFPTHEQAERWGVQRLTVTVWEYADGQPGDFVIAQK